MHIIVGSTNPSKVDAVKEHILGYPYFASAEVVGMQAASGVQDQPKTLTETITGAINRAKTVFRDCDYSIGLESGLMAVPEAKSGYMDVCVAAVYDGDEIHLGLSSAWEFPDPTIMHMILHEGHDMSSAINIAGLTENETIGQAEGAIGILTKGRLDRKAYHKQALITAFIHLDNDISYGQ